MSKLKKASVVFTSRVYNDNFLCGGDNYIVTYNEDEDRITLHLIVESEGSLEGTSFELDSKVDDNLAEACFKNGRLNEMIAVSPFMKQAIKDFLDHLTFDALFFIVAESNDQALIRNCINGWDINGNLKEGVYALED